MLRIALALITAAILVVAFPETADAQRIKDVARVKGNRLQQMKGLGLVVGLAGTGDSTRFALSKKLYSDLLGNLGVEMEAGELLAFTIRTEASNMRSGAPPRRKM